MKVEPIDPLADPATLEALHATCFPDAWDARAMRELFAAGAFGFSCDDGFVLARSAGREAEILTLAVRPAARGKGLGRTLLQAAIKKACETGAATMFLEVGVDNPAALALYVRLGFAKVGDRKAYYNGKDALVLRLPLPGDFA
ncbi:MAG TPA: GNAT family N-acetyltransferase [Rhizomicrobium sp.]|jgi:ribosomal-protein-alanine N-acetyltransferase|nr:GNAT family N-acetyltransferase [Rhizomicrobium sp.]